MQVFLVQHVREMEDGADDVKVIGVYETEEAGMLAIAELRQRPGFREWPDGFHLSPYELNATHWQEGFTTA